MIPSSSNSTFDPDLGFVPPKWSIVRLDEILERLENGLSYKHDEYNAEGVPVTRIETISDGVIDKVKVGYVKDPPQKVIERFRMKKGDILFSHINSTSHIGKTALYNGEPELLLHGMNLLLLRPNQQIVDAKFLTYYLKYKHVRQRLRKISKRAVNQSSINSSDLRNFKIPLPPIADQAAISRFLERVDDVFSKRMEAMSKTAELLQSVFMNMFGSPIDNPHKWDTKSLGDVAEIRSGIQLTRERIPLNSPTPYLTVRNVYSCHLDLSDVRHMEVKERELSRWGLRNGDLLLLEANANRREVGRTAIYSGELKNCVHQNHVFRLRLNTSRLLPVFCMHYINNAQVRAKIFELAKTTSGLNSINMSQLKSLKISCPPLDLQHRFERIAYIVTRTKQRQIQTENIIANLNDSLMSKLFTGKITFSRS